MEGTSGISGWSGHGHAAGGDRSKDQYESGFYLDTFNLSDDEIKEVLKEYLETGDIEFLDSPHGNSTGRQAIRKKDNKYITMQKYLDLIKNYHREKFGPSLLNEKRTYF